MMASGGKLESTFCASVEVVSENNFLKTLVNNALKRIGLKNTWIDVCESLHDEVEVTDEENFALDQNKVSVCLSTQKNFADPVHPDYNDMVKTSIDFNENLKYLKFRIEIPAMQSKSCDTDSSKNAFEMLMATREHPLTKTPKKKDTDGARFTGEKNEYQLCPCFSCK